MFSSFKAAALATLFTSVAALTFAPVARDSVKLDSTILWGQFVTPFTNNVPLLDQRASDSDEWHSTIDFDGETARIDNGGGHLGFRINADPESMVVYRMENIENTDSYNSISYTGSDDGVPNIFNTADIETHFTLLGWGDNIVKRACHTGKARHLAGIYGVTW
ncbi:hypothetical protein C8J57DRAFT_574315 [Mycena rebaudengoi]|nr:hypothetical protein C8J57DRAFT_574315 [Mycena rebaudengoi]